MNDRIQEIVDAVNIPHQVGDHCRMVSDQELKLFAELIVRECAMVVDSKLDFESASGPDDWASGEDVLKHFGIEE